MLLRRLILDDFGLYQGRHEFDLVPRVRHGRVRPIILFGGMNGAGKTTLLEAIRLCLYGRASLGPRVSQAAYRRNLLSRIHRSSSALIHSSTAAVELEFDYALASELSTYSVRRSWEAHPGKDTFETLRITKNGRPLTDMVAEEWQQFVENLVPRSLAQLFFFDGEQIQDLADSVGSSTGVGTAIKALLGLDVIEHLGKDLQRYVYVHDKSNGHSEVDSQLQAFRTRLEHVTTEQDGLDAERAQAMESCEAAQTDYDNAVGQLSAESGAYGQTYEERRAQLAETRAAVTTAEATLRNHAERLLPLALCPDIGDQLVAQLEKEEKRLHLQVVAKRFEEWEGHVLDTLHKGRGTDRKAPAWRILSDVEDKLRVRFEQQRSEYVLAPEHEFIHGVSAGESAHVTNQLRWAVNEVGPECQALAQELANLKSTVRALEAEQKKAPSAGELRQLHAGVGRAEAALEANRSRIEGIDETLADCERRRANIERDIAKVETTQRQSEAARKSAELARATRDVLKEYGEQVAGEKAEVLCTTILEELRRLHRKGDLIQDVAIDPTNYKVTLYGRERQTIPGSRLSAGEKEIFAIALLRALTRAARRPLPVVIDTPLGRLDSAHRENLVKHYFPNASHQVIILSTDTEVDEAVLQELTPEISHAYHLRYDETDQCTVPEEGYFWQWDEERKHAYA